MPYVIKECPMCDTELIKCMWKASHYECPHCKFRCDIEDVDMVSDLKADLKNLNLLIANQKQWIERIKDLKAQLAEAVMLLKTHQDPHAPRHEAVDRFLKSIAKDGE